MEKLTEKQLQEKQSMELLNTELKVKYPPGSYIMFSTRHNKGEKPATTSCGWYDKVGGKKAGEVRQKKNIIPGPPEWQNIPYEEAEKIAEMFADHMFLDLVYW